MQANWTYGQKKSKDNLSCQIIVKKYKLRMVR